MTRHILYTTSLIALLLTSCKKGETVPATPDTIIFGHFYGECMGEQCIEIFKLTNDKLSEDTNDYYPSPTDFYDGNYVQLSEQKFNDTKDLFGSFPSDLLTETITVFGTPDATDGGGLYVECTLNGIRKFWLFDQMKDGVPAKYHAFMDKVNEKIDQLQ